MDLHPAPKVNHVRSLRRCLVSLCDRRRFSSLLPADSRTPKICHRMLHHFPLPVAMLLREWRRRLNHLEKGNNRNRLSAGCYDVVK